ncbi:hypothetical protein PH210_05910 [Paenibacillus sp. BSR1-1]|uniref:CBO0543 family protein n=1 Tax=Paenibacillus sp. BSR1-1 TaxID=3020845 RepID=UPI0025AF9BB6|nr:CBO0543 family protein [Paenibacillus sp. BSR1-1]MDN3015742.1 hypothetical protein [Paenibacillus sp. BSR1-1]
MRLLLSAIFILACWRWANIKNWKQYYPTILYAVVLQLLYRFFVDGDYFLWKIEDDIFLLNETFSFLIITFVIFPCSVFLFLSRYPKHWMKQILYLAGWGALSVMIETGMFLFERVTYHNGWNYWWSMAFDLTMYPMIRFHDVKPIPAWIVSFLMTAFYVIYFNVPLPEH